MISLLAIAALQLPMGQSNLTVQQRPIILTHRELLGYGEVNSFEIPLKTDPSQDTLHMQLFTRQWTRVGGQNRSGESHPGFSFMNNAVAGLDMRFYGDDGSTALPGTWNAHIVGHEWGPTEPASASEFIDPMLWRIECNQDPTCYWGASTYLSGKAYRDDYREYFLEESEPYYQTGKTPGARVHFVSTGWWQDNQGVWDGSHAWPIYVEFEQTTLLYLKWQ